jgi:ATPase family associated with various cellular activities (AAA)
MKKIFNRLHRMSERSFVSNNDSSPLLGEQIEYIVKYFSNIEPKLDTLDCYLLTRGHYDYYSKYGKDFVGLRELGDRYHRGLKEGIVDLGNDVYLVFATFVGETSYVLGFAKNFNDLEPYLLSSSQSRVFSVNYDGELIPHEIKEPTNEIFLNDNLLDEFQQDVKFFLEASEYYKSRSLAYKRSTLFYGPPGNGKTSLLTWAATKFDKIFVIPPSDASPEVAKNINLICSSEESKLIILEDLDSLDERNSDLLNFVDGTISINRSYFIGTTNYPEKLHENILSRPSRFDLLLEVSRPNMKTRESLLRCHLPNLSDDEYSKYAKQTKGLNASYFQEIAVLYHRAAISGKEISIEEIINKCKHRTKLVKTKAFSEKSDEPYALGFSKSGDED